MNYLEEYIDYLGYIVCLADPDLWLKAEINPSNKHKHYQYIQLHIDDVSCTHHDGVSTIKIIDTYFQMKDISIGDPDLCFEIKLQK